MDAFSPTPAERGVLAGLTNRWAANPYPEGMTVPNRDHAEYTKGFEIGLSLNNLTEHAPRLLSLADES